MKFIYATLLYFFVTSLCVAQKKYEYQHPQLHLYSFDLNIQEPILDKAFDMASKQSIGGVSKIKLDDHVIYIIGEKHSESNKSESYFENILNFKNIVVMEEGQGFSCSCEKCSSSLGLEDIHLHKDCLNIINRNIAFQENALGKEDFPFPSKSYFEQNENFSSYLIDYEVFLEQPKYLLREIVSEPRNIIFIQNIETTLKQKKEKYIVIKVGEIHRSYITLHFLENYSDATVEISCTKKSNEILYEQALQQTSLYKLSSDKKVKHIAYKNAIYYLRLIKRNKQCANKILKRQSLENTVQPL